MADFPRTRASLLVRLRDPQDEAAWRDFVDLYAPLVYGYARKQGLQDADAADLSQAVLSSVASAIGRLDYDPRRGSCRGVLRVERRVRPAAVRVGGGAGSLTGSDDDLAGVLADRRRGQSRQGG